MRFSFTMSRYLGRQFLIGISIVLFAVTLLVFVIDLVEALRKFGGRDGVNFAVLVTMTFLKIPGLIEKIIPFTVLFGGMWTFTRLTRSHELVVARASGVSVWQFLAPAMTIGLLIGTFMVAVFNPLSASMNAKYEQMENRYLHGSDSQIAVLRNGIWLRQGTLSHQSVVHALKVHDQGLRLEDVTILLYRGIDHFEGRIDATEASLKAGHWLLSDAWVTFPNQIPEHRDTYEVSTDMTLRDIEDSFASPATMSVWALPRFIEMAETAGFSAVQHRLHWHSILSVPLLLCAMILIAATFSLRMARLGGVTQLIFAGVLFGFGLFFLSEWANALGLSGSLPVALAAWAPSGIAALIGTATLFHLEDG